MPRSLVNRFGLLIFTYIYFGGYFMWYKALRPLVWNFILRMFFSMSCRTLHEIFFGKYLRLSIYLSFPLIFFIYAWILLPPRLCSVFFLYCWVVQILSILKKMILRGYSFVNNFVNLLLSFCSSLFCFTDDSFHFTGCKQALDLLSINILLFKW